MPAIYCTVAEVKRILQTSAEGRIRTSAEAIVGISSRDSNRNPITNITIDPTLVSVSSAYWGKVRLKFEFTNATDFNVYETDLILREDRLLGTGDIATLFSYNAGLVDFGIGTFAGAPVAGDIVEFELDAHISTDNLELMIEDTEVEVDLCISEASVAYVNPPDTRIFTTPAAVPAGVGVATCYLSAHYIYQSVFASKFEGDDKCKRGCRNDWKARAEHLLGKWMKFTGRSIPRILSFPDFFNRQGLQNIGTPPAELKTTVADITVDTESEKIFDPT